MFKLTLLILALSICAVVSHRGFYKKIAYKHVFPLYAYSSLFGKVWNNETQNFSRYCGQIDFIQESFDMPVEVFVNITVKPPMNFTSEHGLHIHEFGTKWSKNHTARCEAAGTHWNPRNSMHGLRNSERRHIGDLGNVVMSEEGHILTNFTDSFIRLAGFESIVGRSVVLHELIDDGGLGGTWLSNTTGSSGARMACGDIVYGCKLGLPRFQKKEIILEELVNNISIRFTNSSDFVDLTLKSSTGVQVEFVNTTIVERPVEKMEKVEIIEKIENLQVDIVERPVEKIEKLEKIEKN